MHKNQYVTVLGSINYDLLIKQDRLPERGETYTGEEFHAAVGGKGANQAVQIAKLKESVKMIGKVGNDGFGDFLLKELRGRDVDVRNIEISNKATGMGIVHTLPQGDVYATVIPGANHDYRSSELSAWEQIIANGKILVLQMEIPVFVIEWAIRVASASGVKTVLNAAPAGLLNSEVLGLVDCLVVNETEAGFYLEKNVNSIEMAVSSITELQRKIRKNGAVIITLGEKGSVLCEGGKVTRIPVFEAEKVVETTGAGDSYIGAFVVGLLKAMTLEEACLLGARAAAFTIGGVGAQEAMPTQEQLEMASSERRI